MNKHALCALLGVFMLMHSALSIRTFMGLPLTKREARSQYKTPVFVKNDDILMKYDLAKLKVANRRAQLGLAAHPLHRPFVQQDDSSSFSNVSPVINTNQIDESLDGATGFILGFAYGFQYS
mmetsp:Transcript_19529/g.18647  ORF Transcript_19529/g.18647 Transcript_19529/m.18647 type:complete len:122 (-) Transcript_19529:415-780(-)